MGDIDILEDKFKEECGLSAAINIPLASEVVKNMLCIQQHRGEEGVGILSSNHHHLHLRKDLGRVDEVFSDDYDFFSNIPGKVAIGHNRYSTRGSISQNFNLQPFLLKNTKYGSMGIAHNGQLHDISNVKRDMIRKGAAFQSNSDSETLAHLILQSDEKNLEQAIADEIVKIPTAYSLLIMTKTKVIALRDKYGVRPLSIAKLGDGYVLSSETSAFNIFEDADFVRDIKPGEMVVFDKKNVKNGEGFYSIQYAKPNEHWCIFEGIYFSDPRSEYNGFMHEDFRQLCGKEVYLENKDFFESLKSKYKRNLAVVPILDSGKQGAIGFKKMFGHEYYKEYFQRTHNAPKSKGRSYTASSDKERISKAHMKLDLRKDKVCGKAVITVDDSLVRGNTAKKNNERLRNAGVEYIVNVIVSPKIKDVCFTGMDHQTKNELLAYRAADNSEIAKNVLADNVVYLSLEGLEKLAFENYGVGICDGCFGGQYSVD